MWALRCTAWRLAGKQLGAAVLAAVWAFGQARAGSWAKVALRGAKAP